MAVTPFRAVVTAQAQSTWNRLMREGGQASVVAAALVVGLVAIAVAPVLLAGVALGNETGRAMAAGRSAASAAAVVQGLVLAIAILGGVLEHQLAFAAEGFRVYPLSRRTLFAAELASGLLGVMAILAAGGALAFHAALAAHVPRAGPLVLLVGVQAVLWVLLVQHLAGGLKRQALSGRPWLAAGAAMTLAGAAVLLVGRALRAGGHEREVLHALGALLRLPPFAAAFRGVEDALRGDWTAGLLRQLVLMAATAALGALVFAFHFRGRAPEARRRAAGAPRLWSFRGPASGMARLFQAEVLASRAGRVALVFPVVLSASIALVVGVLAKAMGELAGAPWPARMITGLPHLPLFGLYLALVPTFQDELWKNQFGWSGPGVRTLFLLPVAPERILLGRMIGLARLHALQAALGAGPLLLVYRPPPAEVAWGLAAGVVGSLVIGAFGHLVSARFPRTLRDQFLGAAATPLTAFVIPMAVQVPLFSTLVLTYELGALAGAWGPALAMWLLAAASAAAYARVLPFLGRRVMALRETLIEELA